MVAETSTSAGFLELSRPHGAIMIPRLKRQQPRMVGAVGLQRDVNDEDCSVRVGGGRGGRGTGCRRRRRPLLAFATLATMLIAALVFPAGDAFLTSHNAGAARLSVGCQREDGLSKLPLNRRRLPAGAGATRHSLRMTSTVGGKEGARKSLRARLGALLVGSGEDTRLQRVRHVASRWLRAAKKVTKTRALTVALAVTLAWPSLSGYPGAGGVAPGSVGGVGGGGSPAAVEVVLPAENAAAATVVSGDVEAGFGGRREAVASRTAFVGPWAQESNAKGGRGAAAVRTPSRAGKNSKVETVERESPTVALRSLATTVGENGREIAEEFGGHIQGAKRDVLVILLSNALIIPLCKRVGLSPVLGFLAAGVMLGPNGLSVVSDVKAIEVLGEMGIVFFLFEMGLELSLSRLMAMKRDVFGMGLATFGVSAGAVAGVGYLAGLTGAQMVVIGGGVALSSSAFVLQLLRDRDDLGTRYGRACFGILLFQDLAVVPLLVAIPLLAGGGGGLVAALSSAATKAAIALGLIAFIGKNILNRFFLLVAKSKSQEAFLAVILLTVIALSSITEGLGLSGTLGAFLAGTLLSETKYTPQVEADIAPFRALLLGMFFMTVGFEIDVALCLNKLPQVASLVTGLLAMKAAIIALIALAFGLSVANAQQTGLLLSQGGEFAFVAFGMAERLGILDRQLCKLLLTTVAISMAATPALSTFSAWVADQMEGRMGYEHYVGGDSESDEIRQSDGFVVVCGYGRIGRLVCELLGKKFINFVAFDNNPLKAMEARNRGLPVFYGDVYRPEVLNAFNVGKAKAVICTLSDVKGTNKAVVNLRREFPDLPIFARAKDSKHQKRLSSIMDVVAMVPTLPEDSIIVSLPFGGAVLRSLGCTGEEVNVLLEDTRKKFVMEKGLENEEDDNLFEQLGISRSVVETYKQEGENGDDDDASDKTDRTGETDLRDASSDSKAAASAAATAAVAAVIGVSPDVITSASSSSSAAAAAAAGGGGAEVHVSDSGAEKESADVSMMAVAADGAGEAAVEEEETTTTEKKKAAAAAAALEAAVASGDVVYPTNADKDGPSGDGGEGGAGESQRAAGGGDRGDGGDEGEGNEGVGKKAGEEELASVGSSEVPP